MHQDLDHTIHSTAENKHKINQWSRPMKHVHETQAKAGNKNYEIVSLFSWLQGKYPSQMSTSYEV